LSNVVGVTEWWHTDGTYLWREGGPKLQGTTAADALRASLEAAASNLPFRVRGDDVFFHVLEPDFTNHYLLYAIDPGWIDPRDRHVTATIQAPGVNMIVDPLTQELLPVSESNTFAFTVPAGSIRILEAHPIPEAGAGAAVFALLFAAQRKLRC
jgi:hypothetical protein